MMIRSLLIAGSAVALTVSCRPAADATPDDPNRPAVVQGPPIILPSDTAKPDTMPAYRDRMSAALAELLPEYSFVTAMTVFGDRLALASQHTADAEVQFGDSTFRGSIVAADARISYFRRSSIKDMVRQSIALNAIDSVYRDSGVYLMVGQRQGGTPVEQRGTYVTTWIRRSADPKWVIRRDHLIPDVSKRR
jgi:acyl-CoA hydrolase